MWRRLRRRSFAPRRPLVLPEQLGLVLVVVLALVAGLASIIWLLVA